MSGTGKSTLIVELAARGCKAVDLDSDEWSEWVDFEDDAHQSTVEPGRDWVWREDRVGELLSCEDAEALFVSGCAVNQVRFYPLFDHVVLLSASPAILVERLKSRTGNSYGKHPGEIARVLKLKQTIEPLLRDSCDFEIDTNAPIDKVVAAVLGLLR
ncbi:MAG TPA: shikimate kinase [Lentisphaeria bacterium]|nr:MAG: hypothetical protein A2X45_24920 [Lentisphaerae bacterium GWF2_50_93]HCE44200.1 shikimate kinase [Lentisphaeria bacterium]